MFFLFFEEEEEKKEGDAEILFQYHLVQSVNSTNNKFCERWTHDQKIASSNPTRSSGRIFFGCQKKSWLDKCDEAFVTGIPPAFTISQQIS